MTDVKVLTAHGYCEEGDMNPQIISFIKSQKPATSWLSEIL